MLPRGVLFCVWLVGGLLPNVHVHGFGYVASGVVPNGYRLID